MSEILHDFKCCRQDALPEAAQSVRDSGISGQNSTWDAVVVSDEPVPELDIDNDECTYSDFSSSDSDECPDLNQSCPTASSEKFNLREGLQNWAVQCQIPHKHITHLLQLLCLDDPDLPKDACILLCTPMATAV